MPGREPNHERSHAAKKPTVADFMATRQRMRQVSADFLKIDIETALTFTHNALSADDEVNRNRNRRAARKAYDTVLRLMKKVDLTKAEGRLLNGGLRRLKADLVTLGESF